MMTLDELKQRLAEKKSKIEALNIHIREVEAEIQSIKNRDNGYKRSRKTFARITSKIC